MQGNKVCVVLLSSVLSSCMTVGPDYQAPILSDQVAWQAALPHQGSATTLTHWWQQFDAPALATLQLSADSNNPSLALAWASIERARAQLKASTAQRWPSVETNARAARSRQVQQDQAHLLNSRSAGFDASWELDLFGKLRRTQEAAQARLLARESDWHEARVSLAAEVADHYVQYRGCRLVEHAYRQDLSSQVKTERLIQLTVKAGLRPPAEGVLTQAGVAKAQERWKAQQVNCELLVKALVALSGVPEKELMALLGEAPVALPEPAGFTLESLPANVLRQRPDLASLERELAAASAQIGVAKADLYPSLSLVGNLAVSVSSLASSASSWSFGPALNLSLFDAGRRQAEVEVAEAEYQGALAAWQQGVRLAVKEVEQALASLSGAEFRTRQGRQAAASYREYFDAMQVQWRAGSESLLNLENARRDALSAEVEYLHLLSAQLQSWIALYKAVGGGWKPELSDVTAQR